MTTSISVPPASERTRDMGSVEQHSPARPPFLAECVKQLGDLERWFGTTVLAEALNSYQRDIGFQARKQGVDPESFVRGIEAIYADLGLPSDGKVAAIRSLPVASPFPGTQLAVA